MKYVQAGMEQISCNAYAYVVRNLLHQRARKEKEGSWQRHIPHIGIAKYLPTLATCKKIHPVEIPKKITKVCILSPYTIENNVANKWIACLKHPVESFVSNASDIRFRLDGRRDLFEFMRGK